MSRAPSPPLPPTHTHDPHSEPVGLTSTGIENSEHWFLKFVPTCHSTSCAPKHGLQTHARTYTLSSQPPCIQFTCSALPLPFILSRNHVSLLFPDLQSTHNSMQQRPSPETPACDLLLRLLTLLPVHENSMIFRAAFLRDSVLSPSFGPEY